MKILLIGSSGFIGSHLMRELLLQKHTVTGFNSESGQDIVKEDMALEAVKDADVVINLAAIVGHGNAKKDPFRAIQVNTYGAGNVAYACARVQKPLIFFSSSAIYGFNDGKWSTEKSCPNPNEIYGSSKLAAEWIVRACGQSLGLSYAILRPSIVYGPGTAMTSPLVTFFNNAKKGDEIVVKGKEYRSYVFIDDLTRAVTLLLEKRPVNGTINISGADFFSFEEIADRVKEETGSSAIITLEDQGSARYQKVDASYAEKILGWKPRVSMKDGLKRTHMWLGQIKD